MFRIEGGSEDDLKDVLLRLGQGLMPFKGRLGPMLERTGYAEMRVYTSAVTHASKVQELGVEAACGISRDADGNLRPE